MKETKKTISKKIASDLNISFRESSSLVDKFLHIIIKNAHVSEYIKISGFGTFIRHLTPIRQGRNPKTGDSYIIEPREKLLFKASNNIRKILN